MPVSVAHRLRAAAWQAVGLEVRAVSARGEWRPPWAATRSRVGRAEARAWAALLASGALLAPAVLLAPGVLLARVVRLAQAASRASMLAYQPQTGAEPMLRRTLLPRM